MINTMARSTDDLRDGGEIIRQAARLYHFAEDEVVERYRMGNPRLHGGEAELRVLDALWVAQQLVDRVLEHSTDAQAKRLAETFQRGPIPDYTDESGPPDWLLKPG